MQIVLYYCHLGHSMNIVLKKDEHTVLGTNSDNVEMHKRLIDKRKNKANKGRKREYKI